MTLPSSGNLSMLQVLDELRTANPGRALPIGLGDSDVRALAGVPSGPIAMSQLYGKSSLAPLTARGNNDYVFANTTTSGGTLYAYPSVTVSGGAGEKTYAWSVLSANGSVTLSQTNASQARVAVTYLKQGFGNVTVFLRCVVTDSSGSVTVDNIVAQLEWEGNL